MARPLVNIEDLRQLARARTPRPFWSYIESGSFEQLTLAANRRDLDALRLRPRALAGVASRDPGTVMLGQRRRLPVALAPTGLAGQIRGDGEIHGARAAEAAGVPFVLSTVSTCPMEAVRAAVREPFWFQLYVMRDRGVVADLLRRAQATGCTTLVLTVDLAVLAPRLQDERCGMTLRPRLFNAPNVIDFARKPAWLWHRLRSPHRSFGNLAPYATGCRQLHEVSAWVSEQLDPGMSWADLSWVRERWPGQLVVKGVIDPRDARQAVSLGADAIVVSNHGGRQLDGAPSSISALPAVCEAVGDRAAVWFDGGVRSGTDVLKALASGAQAAWLGRPWLYGLAAGGEAGVSHMLQLIARELDVAMALCGLRDLSQVGAEQLWPQA
ncbi:MAG: hypothetical protein RI907_3816 [Pseudomonadota bacterium]|jgi:L-lactate dehydrogenase (cytochrome)